MKTQKVYDELLLRTGEANPRPRLEPVQRIANYLGRPQETFNIIHVGGTNGKTSTARAIERILREHGIKTGLFTSPHLINFAERIKIDGEDVSEERLRAGWQEMLPALEIVDKELLGEGQSAITFFEALAVLALVIFSDAPVEVAVIEVGMGGEWDATNIVDAQVAVMTPIGLDHTHILGNTIAEIAKTKAGIIKPGSVVVVADQADEAIAEIEERALKEKAVVYKYSSDFEIVKQTPAVGGQVFTMRNTIGKIYEDMLLPLFGEHQAENMSLAITAVEAYLGLEEQISEDILNSAFADLTSPGRLQVVSRDPLIIVDAAHNPHGAAKTREALQTHFHFNEALLILGVLDDKDAKGLARELLSIADSVFLTAPKSERAKDPAKLLEDTSSFVDDKQIEIFSSLEDALTEATAWAKSGDERLVLVAGSVVLAGEALDITERTKGQK